MVGDGLGILTTPSQHESQSLACQDPFPLGLSQDSPEPSFSIGAAPVVLQSSVNHKSWFYALGLGPQPPSHLPHQLIIPISVPDHLSLAWIQKSSSSSPSFLQSPGRGGQTERSVSLKLLSPLLAPSTVTYIFFVFLHAPHNPAKFLCSTRTTVRFILLIL